MRNLKIILFFLLGLQASAQVQLYDLAPADSTTTFDSVPGGPDFIGITILDTIGLDDYLQIYKKLTVQWTYKPDSVCLSIIDDGREPTCFKIDTVGGGGPGTDTYTYSGVYADDTITIYRTDDDVTSIDSFKIYLPPCPNELIKVNDTTIALINCLDDTLSQITLPKCIQNMYALPDSSNRVVLTWCDGTPKDTVDFFGITIPNNLYADSSAIWTNDTVYVYQRDTTGAIVDSFPIVIPRDSIDSYAYRGTFADDTLTIVRQRAGVDLDSFKVEILIDSDTDIDSMKMIGNVLHLWEDGVHLTTDLSQFLDNTDDQQISLITDGQQDTIILEDGGQIVLHDSVGVTAVVALNGLHNIAPDSIYLGGQLLEDTRIRGNEDAPGLNEYSVYLDTLKNYQITASTNLYHEKIRDTTFSNNRIYNLLGAGQNSSFFYDFGNNTAGRYLINNTGLYASWGDTSDIDSKSALYMNNTGTFINPEDQAGGSEIDSLHVLTAMDTLGRAKWQSAKDARLLDYDFSLLHQDSLLTDIDTLLPLDSINIHQLIWHGGRVRIGSVNQYNTLYPGVNFPIAQDHDDNLGAGIQIYGRRSAIDIYHLTRPYIHMRNDLGEFYHRVYDPTGEGPLSPQRYEIGAVGKYDTDGMETYDTTDRPVFTIMNDADAYSLNITNDYLQSDIYASDRPVDTVAVHALFAADSSGQFILLPFDSLDAINVINPPDSDWLVPVTDAIPGISDDRYTLGRVRIGQDSIETTTAKVIINGGAVPLLTYSSTTANLFRQGTRSDNQRWDYLVQGGALRIIHGDDDAMTQGNYLYMEGGYNGTSFDIMTLRDDGDVSFGLYPKTRNDLDVADSINRIYYPDWNGNLLLASIDSLAAALQETGIIASADSVGSNHTAGSVLFSGGGKSALSDPAIFWNNTTKNLSIGAGTSPARAIHIVENASGGQGITIDNNFSAGYASIAFENDGAGVAAFFLNGTSQSSYGGVGSANFIQVSNAPLTLGTSNIIRQTISGSGGITYNAYNADNNVGIPTYLLGTTSTGVVVKRTFDNIEADMGGPFQPAGSYEPAFSIPTGRVPYGDVDGTTLTNESGFSYDATNNRFYTQRASIGTNAYTGFGFSVDTSTYFRSYIELENGIKDQAGSFGSAGQVLVSNGLTGGAADVTWTTLSGDGNGIYGGSGNIGGATSSVTASLGSAYNFIITHDAANKLAIGTSGTALRSTNGATVLVGDNGDEWGLYYESSQTRLRADNRGVNTYFFIGDVSGAGLQSNGSVSMVGSSASVSATSGTLGLTASGSVDVSAGSTIDFGATSSMSFTGTQFQFTDNSQNLYIFESSGAMVIGNANTTAGTNEYIHISSTEMGLNVASTTIIGMTSTYAQTGTGIEMHIGHGTKIGAANDELEVTGDAYKTVGGVEWNTTSDSRIKRDIEYLDGKEALEIVKHLKPAQYHYTDYWAGKNGVEGNKMFYSYIAQDIEELFPQSVYRSSQTLPGDPDPIRVIDGDAISAHEKAALVQLIKDNEQQAAQIEVLNDQIKKLYQLINKK